MRYTFRCKRCGRVTVAEHGMKEPHPIVCTCSGELQRVFDRPNVVYKGSGFYSTDKALYDPIKPEDYNPDED